MNGKVSSNTAVEPTVAAKLKPINESLRQNLLKEMFTEVEETFNAVADSNSMMPPAKLPLALKALGMSLGDVEDVKNHTEDIDLDKFIEIVLSCMKKPNWAANEMHEVYAIFDKDGSGNIDVTELRRVFHRLGENLMETELQDQLREFDIDGDLEVSYNTNCLIACFLYRIFIC